MPILMLWGHGSFRTSYGYFKVPANVRIEFFIDDNRTIDDAAIRFFEYGDLSLGVSDKLISLAHAVQSTVGRIVKATGAIVKNYKLESIIGDPFASGAKNALRNPNVWTPGKDTNDGEAVTDLVSLVREHAHLGSVPDPLVIQWCACTSNYIGDNEASAPVPRGKKQKNTNSSNSCCYISTATCSSLGLPDDCETLSKLRRFRDQILISFPRGPIDVREYYLSAPAIVMAIENERSSKVIYREIYDTYIVPAITAIDNGDHISAYRIYANMVAGLKHRFLRR